MTGDVGEMFNDELRKEWRRYREDHGVDCPGCIADHPKRTPTRLTPGKRCKVCGYQDTRPKIKRGTP